MEMGLEGKRVLVTGSTAGIGLATAELFARERARVFVNGRSPARIEEACGRIRAAVPGAEVRGVAADLSGAAGAASLLAAVPEVDILVNNLGIFEPKPFEEIPDEDWLRFFETNVMSGVRLDPALPAAHAGAGLGPHRVRLQRVGRADPGRDGPLRHDEDGADGRGPRDGRGLAGQRGDGEPASCRGRRNRRGWGQFVADLGKSRGVDAATVEREFFTSARPSSLLQRFTTPAEVASLIVYVASAAAAATNGAALRVDGGVVRAASRDCFRSSRVPSLRSGPTGAREASRLRRAPAGGW